MSTTPAAGKMRLLFVLENYFPNVGGVEILFKNLAERLAEKGHHITIITTQLSPEHPHEEQAGNLRILRYNFHNRYLFTLLAVFPVWRHAKNCDLIHTTSYNAALPAFLGAWLRRKKTIVTFHEVWGDLWFRLPFMSGFGSRVHWLFEQMLLWLPFGKFVGVSHFTAGALRAAGVPPGKVCAILNGIDYQDFAKQKNSTDSTLSAVSTLPKTAFTYTFFGRLGVSKGLDILLEAAQVFQQKHPGARLQLIVPTTPAPMFDWLKKRLAELGLENQTALRHHLSFEELKTALAASDCVAIPSLSEGFCFAAVESMALGVPIVSSGLGALAEVIGGRYVEMEGHSTEALVRALEKAKAGKWTVAPLKKFELEKTVESYLELYQKLTFGSPLHG